MGFRDIDIRSKIRSGRYVLALCPGASVKCSCEKIYPVKYPVRTFAQYTLLSATKLAHLWSSPESILTTTDCLPKPQCVHAECKCVVTLRRPKADCLRKL